MHEAVVEAGGWRMLRALEYMHSKGMVHMDVRCMTLSSVQGAACMPVALLRLPMHQLLTLYSDVEFAGGQHVCGCVWKLVAW